MIYDDDNLKKTFGLHSLYNNNSLLYGLSFTTFFHVLRDHCSRIHVCVLVSKEISQLFILCFFKLVFLIPRFFIVKIQISSKF